MTHTVSHAIAQALKAAGFPQPEPMAGQFWYKTIFEGGTQEYTTLCICLEYHNQIVMQAVVPRWDYPGNSGPDKNATFAPTVEDIAPHLPKHFALEMWRNKPSCRDKPHVSQIITFGDNFAEAAAEMWLTIQRTKT